MDVEEVISKAKAYQNPGILNDAVSTYTGNYMGEPGYLYYRRIRLTKCSIAENGCESKTFRRRSLIATTEICSLMVANAKS